MSGADETRSLAEQLRQHFGHRDHLYGVLLAAMADDLEAGGVTAEILADHLDAPREQVVQLRLLAGIFRIVLRGDAPQLVPYYPSLGGDADPADAWAVVRDVMASHVDELVRALDLPPQTNEVGRSACLLAGLFEVVRRRGLHRVRLLEPGASAGLNLLVDRFRFSGPGWAWGPSHSPLHLDTDAVLEPVHLEVVERRGCDLAPIDASTDDGAHLLTSYVWPFDVERHARLAAALELVRRHPVTVDPAPASQWLADRLAEPVPADVVTVVWHSITRQYWPQDEVDAVDRLVEEGRDRMPLSHVSMEGTPPTLAPGGYDVALHGPEVSVDGDVIARAHHHGLPLVLMPGGGRPPSP
jgi:hypothetical protein